MNDQEREAFIEGFLAGFATLTDEDEIHDENAVVVPAYATFEQLTAVAELLWNIRQES